MYLQFVQHLHPQLCSLTHNCSRTRLRALSLSLNSLQLFWWQTRSGRGSNRRTEEPAQNGCLFWRIMVYVA